MAILANETAPGFEQHAGEGFREYMSRTDKLFNDLLDKEAALPDGTYEGVILRFPFADGYAFYVVSKVRPLTLQHIPYGDAWHIPEAHLRGLNMTDVQAQAKRNKDLRSMFPRKS
jgi:hypothetical protein